MGYDKGTGICGIWVEITTQITDTNVEIDVAGEPGHTDGSPHDWTELEVVVKAKKTAAGPWETKFDISTPNQTWSNSFPKAGYFLYQVTAKGYDTYGNTHRGRSTARVEEAIYRQATSGE